MSVIVKMLGPGDSGVLDHVAPDVFDDALEPKLVAEFIGDERHHVAVAIDRGQVVGFASGVHYVHPDKPAELWINEVGVAPSRRGQGLGKAIVSTLLQHAKSLGCREAWVLTDRENQAAMRLYSSAGGRASDHVMFNFSLEATDALDGNEHP
jgi:aminoglycoside 6'-N-acetyltransferase I